MYGRSAGVQCSSQPHGFSIRLTYGESENSVRSDHGKGLFTPESVNIQGEPLRREALKE